MKLLILIAIAALGFAQEHKTYIVSKDGETSISRNEPSGELLLTNPGSSISVVTINDTGEKESLEIKELTKSEHESLEAVRAAHAKALAKMQETEAAIRAKYGDAPSTGWTFATCHQPWTKVELRGKYALITSGSYNMCGGYSIQTPKETK